MPRINRVRIVNFSYNNDSRHILDEKFNFYGGENVLLSLANGGGKSVLVQLMLQPVIPCSRIQGRNIASFFQKAKLPAYIMIEWKLDGAGGYLLTGIAIMPVEGHAEDNRERIRFFTFTSKYGGTNAFDIYNIAVAERKGSIINVLPFRDARVMMSDREKKDPYNFRYFPEDEVSRYSKYLAEFGIVQSEWRTVIARINDNEHGLEEIFQKYKNSSQLLDDWIIKTIEQAQFKNRSEAHQLEEMLSNLVQEVVENERFIIEKQLLNDFLIAFHAQIDKLHGLLNGLDQQMQLSQQIAALHRQLGLTTGSLKEQHAANEQALASCHAEEQRIQLEERSNDYWLRKSEHENAYQRLQTAEIKTRSTEKSLQYNNLQDKIMRAAYLIAEIQHQQAELSGIEESLEMTRQKYDTDGRMRSLEYSLKLLYEVSLATLASDIAELQANKTSQENMLKQTQIDLQKADSEKSHLDEEKGLLTGEKLRFEKYEEKIYQQLKIRLNRNLLGDLEPEEIQNSQVTLESKRDELTKSVESLDDEKQNSGLRRQEIQETVKSLQTERAEAYSALNDINRDILEYEQKEAEIFAILEQYGLESQLRFNQDKLALIFKQKVKELEARVQESARLKDDATESILALRDGTLHTPKELIFVFSDNDIQYETGEAYLRTLEPNLRQRMLAGNPLLPYAFIISQADIERLPEALHNITLRRVIPLFTYEDLATTVKSHGRIAYTQDKLAFACLYEGRMFEHISLEKLLAELEREKASAGEQHDHWLKVHHAAMSAQTICSRFNYPADYHYGLEKSRIAAQSKVQSIEIAISALEDENRRLTGLEIELEQQLKVQKQALQKANENVSLFTEYISREFDYQECRQKLNNALKAIEKLKTRKAELNKQLDSLRISLDNTKNALHEKDKYQQATQLRYDALKNAPETEVVVGTIAELEKRLESLSKDYKSEIIFLEQRRKELTTDSNKKQKELNKLGLPEETYYNTAYDEREADRIRAEILRLEELLKTDQQEEKDAISQEGSAKGELKSALIEIQRLNFDEPLSSGEIKLNFEERRQIIFKNVEDLNEKNNTIADKLYSYQQILVKIEQLIDLGSTEASKEFRLDHNVMAQAKFLEQSFNAIKEENEDNSKYLRATYSELKANYQGKNTNIDNIFKGLSLLWDKPGMEFNNYYYLYERMVEHAGKLSDLIKLYELQLTNLENNKKDMVQQSFIHSISLFEEIQWISNNSKIRLEGRSKPVQMLNINMQLDSQETARQRMTIYIEECIQTVREEIRQEKSVDQVNKTVAKLMSSRLLLNEFLGNSNIQISVFKIDINKHNSRLKRWEDAVRENSGGEKFVTFFSVLSALMTYSRSRATQAAGGDFDNDTRVLIMDNPFGPISSEHLLAPLFEIARKHRTQLICLSDLKQNSIMNCFNLIYMLKVRTTVIGNNEYLKFDEIIRDESLIHSDEKLEKAGFRTSEARQVSLFEEI